MLLFASTVWGALENNEGELIKKHLVVGLIDTAFDDISQNDAEAAFKIYVRTVGATYGYDVDIDVFYFADEEEFTSLQEKQKPDVVFFEIWNWIGLADDSYLEPLLVTFDEGKVGERYLLVSKKFEDNSDISLLKGSSVNVFSGPNSRLAGRWLDSLIYSKFNRGMDQFFSVVSENNDPIQVILPVFFGKKDLAVIPENKFDLMAELNPQMNKLSRLASSELFVPGVICMKKEGWESEHFHQVLIKGMQEMHLQPAGRQMMTLFKMSQLVPFKPEYLDTVRELKSALNRVNKS
ncbi:phosphonate transport system substrate-binding protein [Malonomonas rubra DSM 5091]|uniref:Phosphonate transport system substrate-binding protein n=1 Tax=Malonomonas rubra DSM 5091 TaxID=1122189 RepID=A0A1M6NE33_MALRU|nr:PhnD/SsuA/transferrin family substrate-binding protein [Malonomonas rubra]SHJ93965.1 phosphonate transport system substrate-binding protein [Malonomonas rubra DSM 5091]